MIYVKYGIWFICGVFCGAKLYKDYVASRINFVINKELGKDIERKLNRKIKEMRRK